MINSDRRVYRPDTPITGQPLVYFDATVAPFGSTAERTLVPEDSLISVPEDVDPVILAGLGNAGLAAHPALHWRAELQVGESVVVLGATGVVGQLAVQIARLLGAGRVVAVVRNPEELARTAELGADATVQLGAVDDLPGALAGANVIVDLLWGGPALAQAAPGVLRGLHPTRPARWYRNPAAGHARA
jgi:NADPH:quinone reductase-like Zn-dependent oxidoreductase